MSKKFKIYLITSLFTLGSCSIAGSWVYERADGYLAKYFKEYADFSNEQESEIDKALESRTPGRIQEGRWPSSYGRCFGIY